MHRSRDMSLARSAYIRPRCHRCCWRYWERSVKKLTLLVLWPPILAHAYSWLQFEADVGQSHYTGSGSGTYYEDGPNFPHTLNFTKVGAEAGVTGNLVQRETWGVDWHADYVNLGYESFDGLVDSDDANFNPQTGGWNGPCAPTARFLGGGTVSGIALTLEPLYDYRGVRYGVLAGPFIYRPNMRRGAVLP